MRIRRPLVLITAGFAGVVLAPATTIFVVAGRDEGKLTACEAAALQIRKIRKIPVKDVVYRERHGALSSSLFERLATGQFTDVTGRPSSEVELLMRPGAVGFVQLAQDVFTPRDEEFTTGRVGQSMNRLLIACDLVDEPPGR